MTRRTANTIAELGALCFAALLWLSQTVSMAHGWQLASIWITLAVTAAALAHARLPAEPLVNTGVLLITGWLFMVRLDPQSGWEHWRGIMFGLAAFAAALPFDWRLFRFKYLAGWSAVLLLAFTIIFGEEAGGARAWLRIGGLRFQPVELAKIGMLLFAAAYIGEHAAVLLSKKQLRLKPWVPLMVLLGFMVLCLAVSRDLGPALLFVLVTASMVFFHRFDWRIFLAAAAAAAIGGGLAWLGFAHVRQRIVLWLNPWAEPAGLGFQTVHSLFAVHNGGLFGRGLGFGLGADIPAVHTDFIFALICEEIGLLGATALLGFYLLLVFFGLKTAAKLTGPSQVLTVGISLLWVYQVFFVAGGALNVIPLSGMTLPFVSFGSTSIAANMFLLGIVTRLSASPAQKVDALYESWRVKRVFRLAVALFAVLWGAAAYWQLIRADLADHPINPKVMLAYKSSRGRIYDRRGVLLADSDWDGQQYIRSYFGHPSLSHVIGYFHPRFGMTGVEAAYNSQLVKNRDIYLTIDAELQAAVGRHMGGQRGAVVVTNPCTGEILALYAAPYIDPNHLNEYWEEYVSDPSSPFYNRATQGVYPPGSAIKPFILAAAYQTGLAAADTSWMDEGMASFGSREISNYQGQAFGLISTQEALAYSSNIVFAQLAVELKAEGLRYLKEFGFGDRPGSLPAPPHDELGWAQIGIGQGEILVTPLQMVSAVGTIANRGMRMGLYLVKPVPPYWLTGMFFGPRALGQVVTQRTAALVRAGMVDVVAYGTGRAAQIPGTAVAGKTGTAENAHGRDHAWFIGFAPAENPRVAVAVLVEHGGYGGGSAAQIGGQVLMEALDRL